MPWYLYRPGDRTIRGPFSSYGLAFHAKAEDERVIASQDPKMPTKRIDESLSEVGLGMERCPACGRSGPVERS